MQLPQVAFLGKGAKKLKTKSPKKELIWCRLGDATVTASFSVERGWGRGILTEDNEDYTLIMQKYLQILPYPP